MSKVKTRDRILTTSLLLFNGIGEPNVTTLLIADELDISPGNLYYHFKSKGDIVGELFGRYEAELLDLLSVPADAWISLDDNNVFLHLLFEAVARYRFLYQDLVNVLSRYDTLQKRFRSILKKKHRAFQTICHSLQAQGVMTIRDDELDALCEQLTLTTCYWSSYDSLSHLDDRDAMDPGRGVFQMMCLLRPYLIDEEREQIRLMSESYYSSSSPRSPRS
ncbi:TetR/AcrR family transcriptional regulator [Marinobacter sp. X15-166B]|uniref:TetR/AcrR family transcriptional regulator n=1 Tax=Marinobacter sp. X15-166B TaxID=1897620 RepID=UPI00085C56B8|nr:TetR/AcrR family transcriptional regulator [Marinobacter sp. X15-166B]OEY67638.1 TetR family transcriptional regulator [Marinobacter sp. X15-166B]